ncbi:hypothetical protein J4Q44_G00229950 [Coregonus suidteri]|uniref:Uncharacterized protein n=1 Tax=Coregonus suidteri TaxID=861788 RepID=A0AAN8LG79_9TELE
MVMSTYLEFMGRVLLQNARFFSSLLTQTAGQYNQQFPPSTLCPPSSLFSPSSLCPPSSLFPPSPLFPPSSLFPPFTLFPPSSLFPPSTLFHPSSPSVRWTSCWVV